MSSSPEFQLPQVFPYHVFLCSQQRPPGHPRGSCLGSGGQRLWERLNLQVQRRQLASVSLVSTTCLGFCHAGPLFVVYPEGVWYRPESEEDIDEIVESHFEKGCIVERLAVVLSP